MNKRTGYEMPSTTVRLVAALCGDYIRMKEALKREKSDQKKLTYFTYTYTIYDEIAKATGLVGCYVDVMIGDIADHKGYDKSELSGMLSRGKYYRGKTKAIYKIAEALFLY